MNAPPSRPSRWRRILLVLAVVATVGTLSLACGIYNVVTLSRPASSLKKSLVQASGATISSKIQISAGPLLLCVARVVASQIKDVPPEALIALRSVRSVSVGVFQLAQTRAPAAELVDLSDTLMQHRGWHRAIEVRDGRAQVLIYLPNQTRRRGILEACVAVLEKNQLVVVSGEVKGNMLWPLIARELPSRSAATVPVEQI